MATKIERLDLRLARRDKELLEKAAAIKGQSLTSFTVSALREKAEDILAKAGNTELTRRDMNLFSNLLDEEKAPNAALRAAARRLKTGRG